mgnify:CR=1 FL=1
MKALEANYHAPVVKIRTQSNYEARTVAETIGGKEYTETFYYNNNLTPAQNAKVESVMWADITQRVVLAKDTQEVDATEHQQAVTNQDVANDENTLSALRNQIASEEDEITRRQSFARDESERRAQEIQTWNDNLQARRESLNRLEA